MPQALPAMELLRIPDLMRHEKDQLQNPLSKDFPASTKNLLKSLPKLPWMSSLALAPSPGRGERGSERIHPAAPRCLLDLSRLGKDAQIPDCHPRSLLFRSQRGFYFRCGIAEVAVVGDESGLWCFSVFALGFFWLNRSQGSSNRRCWNTAAVSGKIKAWSRHWVGKCPFCCWWGRDWEPDLKLSHRDAKRSALSHPGADISSDSLAFVTTLCPTSSP